ncbi:hypothetical protein Tco_0132578 [Tanacetum coccineum]
MYDQEVALNLQDQLQGELEEEERLTRQMEEEANIALIESCDNTQAMMDADYQMAQQLQAKEQEKLSIKEKSKLFVQILEARKKHFAEMRAREKRNKPPTQAQQRKLYCNYLKNMEGYTLKQLKGFKFEVIKDMNFDREDLETLWKLVKAKNGSTRPEEGYERMLWGDLMTITLSEVAIYAYLYAGREKLLKLITKQLKNPGSRRIVRIKSLLMLFGITVALIKVSVAQEESAAGTKVTTVGVKVTTA